MTQVQAISGTFASISKGLFEKIQSNSEEIGKLKLEPFNIKTVERVRAIYRENDTLFKTLIGTTIEEYTQKVK